MKIVMICGEALPFIKVGGLGDVVYSLSKKLVSKKINTSIILPLYKKIKENNELFKNMEKVTSFSFNMSWRNVQADFYKINYKGIDYYFLSNDYYFNRDDIYGEYDDIERYSFFSYAIFIFIKEYLKKIDIIHLHDWHGGMIPLLFKHYCKNFNVGFMLTIHNPCFQGICDREDLGNYFNLPNQYFDEGLVRFNDKVNFLKTAIVLSDRINTVSPTHRKEILSGISSYGLENILKERKSDFVGILNGLDNKEFNPSTDKYINYKFDKESVLRNKKLNKIKLCEELHLNNSSYPLFCLVSRLTYQKGISFLLKNIEKILKLKINIVILGQGEQEFEKQLAFYSLKYHNLKCIFKFSNSLAHKLYASSDFFLMPSFFEPCGISQMIALRYGSLPIATKVGGLIDTIIPYNKINEEYANGFLFTLDDDYFIVNINLALDMYNNDRRIYSKIVHNAMNSNFSWTKSCEEYCRLYLQIIQKNIAYKDKR